MSYALRVFFVGGLISFRALFGFMRPEIYVPSLLVGPIFQILLFVYIGRSAGLESDGFYVIGNALQFASIPCLFAMLFTIGGERWEKTLSYLLITPAPRLPLYVGRAVPVMLNGFVVAVFSLVVGSAIVGVDIPGSAWPALLLVTLVSVFACTGFGLLAAAWGLLIQDQAVLANVLVGILLVFSGANAPIDSLPGWLQTLSHALPFRHGIEAARRLADGESLGAVAWLVAAELAVGVAYATLGYVAIRRVEVLSRRRATLERA